MKKLTFSIFSWILPFFIFSQSYEIQYAQPQGFATSAEEGFSRYSTLKLKQDKSLFILHGTAGFDAANEERQELTVVTAEPDRWYCGKPTYGISRRA